MHPGIRVSVESERGCGYRRAGGCYLVTDGPGMACGRLPIPLLVCPCCGAGIKPCRGWTWVDGDVLTAANPCQATPCEPLCPMGGVQGRVGLIWVGEKFYPSPQDFAAEAQRMGISRRLKGVPKDFIVGTTWVWLAHRKVLPRPCACTLADRPQPWESETWRCEECDGEETLWTPGVFTAFRPQRIKVVVTGEEPDEEIDALIKRGLSPIFVIKDKEHAPLFGDPP